MATLFDALRAGKQLANSTTWKNAQALGSALAAVGGFVVALLPLLGVDAHGITPDLVGQIATGIGLVVGGVLNAYATVATSKSVGFGKPSASGTAPGVPDVAPGVDARSVPAGDQPIRPPVAAPGTEHVDKSPFDQGTIMG